METCEIANINIIEETERDGMALGGGYPRAPFRLFSVEVDNKNKIIYYSIISTRNSMFSEHSENFAR